MGWNEQVDRFKNIEEKVLEAGQGQITWGTTVARGKSRTIIAYKEAIYRERQIVGLLGFFSDVSQQQDLGAILQRADQYLYQSKEQGRKRLTDEN